MASTLAGLVCALICILALLAPAVSWGGESDPTLAPASAKTSPATTTGEAPTAAPLPVLESVLIPAHGRALAIISGRAVAVGDMVGEAKLIRIREGEVVLRSAGGETHLFLYPDVSIKPATRAPGKQSAGRKNTP